MNHKDLVAWKEAIYLVEEIYKVSSKFPKQETYGLISQIRRAAVSIPSNISEGAARNGNKEYCNFLGISLGSLAELETQLIIAAKLDYADVDELLVTVSHVRSLIIGLRNHVQTKLS
jgi:four helix bundle protein